MFDYGEVIQPFPDAVSDLQEMLQQRGTTPAAGALPVHPRLAPAFPSGLRPGVVYSLVGSVSIALALLAGPSQHGAWCGVVGLPDLGVEAAAAWGVDLDRLVLVPAPEPPQWVSTVAALAEVAGVVVAASPGRLSGGEVQRLTARLRTRRTSLVVIGPWERPAATVRATTVGWDGLAQGHGALTRQHVRLDITERHQQRSCCLTIPETP
ncbi:hypothetical protein [Luteipulveratus flavus]|uniref:Recombinase A n=1 Tax=Luteipulveratus flavus TaxID=3031728 RepID=A0ABT6C518_9MICO|nr:hypothetical protein [Luteipulveratus sp. YIM 133296]MDF8263154.1 hypothetical protein [Luteipulveratus sp. YIM 133296]